jgi:hypothetical protein
MKKILLIIAFLGLIFSSYAQEKTISKTLPDGSTYLDYIGVSSDTLMTTNQDTIDFKVKYQSAEYVKKIAVHIEIDTIAGLDTVSVQVLGYDFYADGTSNEIIAASTTNVTSTSDIIISDDYMSAADEFSFRFYVIRIIKIGVGGGLIIKEIELKIYTE